MRLTDIPRFTRTPTYHITGDWKSFFEYWLLEHTPNLNPDFQRAHVWTKAKQVAYVEFCLRGGSSSRAILFNQPGWNAGERGDLVLVDGKQRIEAVRRFLSDEIAVFGHRLSEFADKLRHHEYCFDIHVNDLKTRAEVLQWYLDIYTGGVVHTDVELDKVRHLLELEKRGKS